MSKNTTESDDVTFLNVKPKIDLNPFYRTMDIFNGVFHKKVKFERGAKNSTDLKTIWVNLNELMFKPIARVEQPENATYHYTLDCGHKWDSKKSFAVGKLVPCWSCSGNQSYLGLEHEWEHITFKTSLTARTLFVERYVAQLTAQTPNLSKDRLTDFLHLLVNAFDDIRVNSLQERVYPGSAHKLWARWRRILSERGDYDQTFLGFTLAIGVSLDVDPKGPFYQFRQVIEWGMAKAKYRSFSRMLLSIRAVLDRCMGALLAYVPPEPPSKTQGGSQDGETSQEHQSANIGIEGKKEGGQKADSDGGPKERDIENGSGDSNNTHPGNQSSAGPPNPPVPSQTQTADEKREQAVSVLIDGATPLDDKEVHPKATTQDILDDPYSMAIRAEVIQVFKEDINDLDRLDQLMPSDQPDDDMQKIIDVLRNAIPERSRDSKLLDDARAKVVLVDVKPSNIIETSYVVLDDEEDKTVERVRSLFYRELGRKKAFRDITGPAVDIPAFIQFRTDHRDPNVFEGEAINKGFAYHVVSDMSGSMTGTFPVVARAMTILKQALDFPFVRGEFWGFRGGGSDDVNWKHKSHSNYSDVWLYRYHQKCKGYLGNATITFSGGGKKSIPVTCGGLTPMHSALRVAIKHMNITVPSGMAKRLYLLTDGSPFHLDVSGVHMSETMLRGFVAKEIKWARMHGIDVYTVVIGDGIKEEHAIGMFGGKRFWRRTNTENLVGKILSSLVMDNFSKYLRAR